MLQSKESMSQGVMHEKQKQPTLRAMYERVACQERSLSTTVHSQNVGTREFSIGAAGGCAFVRNGPVTATTSAVPAAQKEKAAFSTGGNRNCQGLTQFPMSSGGIAKWLTRVLKCVSTLKENACNSYVVTVELANFEGLGRCFHRLSLGARRVDYLNAYSHRVTPSGLLI